MKQLSAETLFEAKALARELRHGAWQDKVFPLSEKMERTLAAVFVEKPLVTQDIEDADKAASNGWGMVATTKLRLAPQQRVLPSLLPKRFLLSGCSPSSITSTRWGR